MNVRSRPVALWLAWGVMPLLSAGAGAMGLRSFVALPVEQGGAVLRMQLPHNADSDVTSAIANLAWGIGPRQTLLLGLPYRLDPPGANRVGDLGVLYRHIVWQDDQVEGTTRIGALGGAVLPSDSGRDAALQAGFVLTRYRDRGEWDVDLLYQAGLDQRLDSGRYDISRQYRLAPAEYPDWGRISEWDGVVELNGRWREGATVTHQVTIGLQWIQRRYVLEAGVVRDLNGANATQYLVSVRFHP